MSKELWTAVDQYFTEKLIPPDPVLASALKANTAAGLPAIDVTPTQGKFLQLLARIHGARKILEIGTLGGYSTIWLARALPPGGKLITLEAENKHAEIARTNLARAELTSIVDIRLGPALQSLERLLEEGAGPFDFIFIDADKKNNPGYLDWSLRLARPGSIIICDNVVRDGKVVDPENSDPDIQGIRHFFEKLAADVRLDATALQTVGSKGYDGFMMGVVK